MGTIGKKFLPSILGLLLTTLICPYALANDKSMFEIAKDGTITIQTTNARLQDLLKNFCSTFNVDVRGIPATAEPVSISLSRATFDETLKRLLRGYNYVLIQDEPSRKPAVVILGKAERAKYVDEPIPVREATGPSIPAPAPTPAGHGTAAPQPERAPRQTSLSPKKTGPIEQQKKPEEAVIGEAVVASARVTRSLRTDAPPMPPQIPGLELPPTPPSIEEARALGQTAALQSPPQIPEENSSGQVAIQTPPEIPASENKTREKPKPTLDLKDLAPPSIPF